MLKPLLFAISCAAAGAVVSTFVGRTEYSTSLRASIPFGSAVKVTTDPSNVWSWHHRFTGAQPQVLQSADVLVDINGDQVMDTANSFLRLLITDLQLVSADGSAGAGAVRIHDSEGVRLAASVGSGNASGNVHHVSLATPIVLPVGSSLRVELEPLSAARFFEVNMIGRVVNL
jgi:hypothetical protein